MPFQSVDAHSSASTSTYSDSEGPPVESLVAGRQRRSTAGTRLNALIADEPDEDDELRLLFAETGEDGEEDMEFEGSGDEAASDVEMGSSSDDDAGPTVGAEGDALEGEKEIERQVREERARKRKKLEVFGKGAKRTKGTAGSTRPGVPVQEAPPMALTLQKARRKGERVTLDDEPTRQSLRKQTMRNKLEVQERMLLDEKRRKKQLQSMEAARERKEAEMQSKAMTQEDRLEEAARVEAKNARSLNRWEAAEEKRVGEQRAKIAALKDRKLDGPVISWWSGPGKWVGGRLVGSGRRVLKGVDGNNSASWERATKDEKHPRKRREADNDVDMMRQDGSLKDEQQEVWTGEEALVREDKLREESEGIMKDEDAIQNQVDALAMSAAMPTSADQTTANTPTANSTPAPTNALSDGNGQTSTYHLPLRQDSPNRTDTLVPLAPILPPQPTMEIATRSLVILDKIDVNASKLPELQDHVLLRKRGHAKPSSKFTTTELRRTVEITRQ